MSGELDKLIAVLERIAEALEDSQHAAAFVAASIVMARVENIKNAAPALEALKDLILADIRGEERTGDLKITLKKPDQA